MAVSERSDPLRRLTPSGRCWGCDMTVSVELSTDALWSELERLAAFRDCLTNQEFLAWLESTMPKEDE